jgi:anti-sigma28 factor (negative regulator of flagellin synthesis)
MEEQMKDGGNDLTAAREARIAELKARYEAGRLEVDVAAVAVKLVELHCAAPVAESDKV